jgi:hypothetical protein
MRNVASILVIALATITWATCVGAAGDSPMACCVKVQHDCPKMDHVKMCCPTRQETSPESSAARLEPIASLSIQSNAGFLAHAATLPIVETSFHTLRTATEVSPPTRHSIDCILLI